jgi:hypothetical protein
LDHDSSAALNIYSSVPQAVSGEDISRAEMFAVESAKTLRLELRLAWLQEAKSNLEAAMKSRTVIDVAAGIIMAQNRCSHASAMTVLHKASSGRNIKLREVAEGVVRSVSAEKLETYFDE